MSDETNPQTEELKTVYGIDLGTTYSCISYVDEHERAVVVPNLENHRTTPSVVYFEAEGKHPVVGQVAKDCSHIYPDKVAMLFKRQMGDDKFSFEVFDQQYRPEVLSHFVLDKLAKDAGQQTRKEVKDVVITCPAWFGEVQRDATKKAGEIAGLTVHKVLNEPTAAAISYGLESAEDETVLVYDLGGGTFDVTMIDVKKDAIQVICTGGDHELGGRDWDEAIVRYILEQAADQVDEAESLHSDTEFLQELYQLAEKAKISLASRATFPISLRTDGGKVRVELTREKLEEITSELLETTISLTRDMLNEARAKREEMAEDPERGFDKILLVGGSTKMPRIQERLEQEFSVPCEAYDQDEAVARGAAQFGRLLAIGMAVEEVRRDLAGEAGDDCGGETTVATQEQIDIAKDIVAKRHKLPAGATDSVKITDVASHTYGIAVQDERGEMVVQNMIRRNTNLPTTIKEAFGVVVDNQESVEIQLMENGSTDPIATMDESKQILSGILELPPGMIADEDTVDVEFMLNRDGILEVNAQDRKSGKSVDLRVETGSSMTDEEVAEAKEKSSRLQRTPHA